MHFFSKPFFESLHGKDRHEAAPAAHISVHAFENTFMIQAVAPWALKPGQNKGIKATKSLRTTQVYFY